jgi:formate-dependent nitrite reductase membrane component NrfD
MIHAEVKAMAAGQSKKTNGKKGKGALTTFFLLFAFYFVNVLVGKAKVSYGLNLPHLGNVAEFLLLSVACVALIVAALKREAAEKKSSTETKGDEK